MKSNFVGENLFLKQVNWDINYCGTDIPELFEFDSLRTTS